MKRLVILLFAAILYNVVSGNQNQFSLAEDISSAKVGLGACSNCTYSTHFGVELTLPKYNISSKLLGKLVSLITSGSQSNNSLAESMWIERCQFINWSRTTVNDEAASWTKDTYSDPHYVYRITGKLLFQNGSYLSYSVGTTWYSGIVMGGGLYPVISNATFCIKTSRRLTADDLVLSANRRRLLNLIRLNLSRQHKGELFAHYASPETRTDKEIDEVNSWVGKGDTGTPTVTDNFCFTTNGIMWTYNVYEVASGDCGNVDVVVPWKELKPILKTDFMTKVVR